MTLMSIRGLEYMDSIVIARGLLCMTLMSANMYSTGVIAQRAGVYVLGAWPLKRKDNGTSGCTKDAAIYL